MKNSSGKTNPNKDSKWASAGLFAALSASICCITPLLAMLSGASGVASTFSWAEPLRPYLIGLTVLILGFAWYQKIRKSKQEQQDCVCETDQPKSFFQSNSFLGIITLFAIGLLAFPSYAHIFYANTIQSESLVYQDKSTSSINTIEFKIKGMTCAGCEAHIEHEVGKLAGIQKVKASYDQGNTVVAYNSSAVNLADIKNAIDKTGYQVIDEKQTQHAKSVDEMEAISFFRVPLICKAATSIGCGSRAKPIVKDLEETDMINEAWLNRQGTIIAVVWNPNASLTKGIEIANRIFNDHAIKTEQLVLNDYAENFDSFRQKENWLRGESLNQLSKEEATIIAGRLIQAIQSKTELDADMEQKLRSKIEDSFYDLFLNFSSVDELSDPEVYKKLLTDIKIYGDELMGNGKMPELEQLWSICAKGSASCEHKGTEGKSCCKSKKL